MNRYGFRIFLIVIALIIVAVLLMRYTPILPVPWATLGTCNFVQDSWARWGCYGRLSNRAQRVSDCQSFPSDQSVYKDICYFNIAGRTNVGTCEYIIDGGIKNSCYFSSAVRLNDKNLCNKIGGEGGYSLLCVAEVTRDPKVCDLMRGRETYSDQICYYRMANILHDTKYCDLVNSDMKSSCVEEAISNKENPSL